MTPESNLFDVTEFTQRSVEGVLERVPLDEFELARNPRRDISKDGIDRLAGMLMRTGQLVPVIARRDADKVRLYAGQRRLLAARASHDLAGADGYEGLAPIGGLIALLLDYEPTDADIRRIQAQENQREDLSMRDQQEQFRDCWQDRAGLPEADRIAMVCADLGISPKKAHNLRKQLTLPDLIRARVSDRPSGEGISVTLANRLADMHQTSPELVGAVAQRITSTDLHDRALRDLGAFVHKTVVEDENLYAVRIDEGAMLDAHAQLQRARASLSEQHIAQVAQLLACKPEEADKELDALGARAKTKALKIRVDSVLRERAKNGNYAYTHHRGEDFADGIWVVDPVFMIDVVCDQLDGAGDVAAREETFFCGAKVDDDDLKHAAEEDRKRKEHENKRRREAANSNVGLGADVAAGLMAPSGEQLRAVQAIVCHLIARHYPEVIAYGAGWTDQTRQQPVGDTGRYEPRQIDAVLDAELRRALEDPDALRGIANLTARWAAAFVLDPDGVIKTKALGTERMSRKLRDALPGGQSPLRNAVWALMRPMLSPRLAARHHDEFVVDDQSVSTVDLHAHRQDSGLDDLDLGDNDDDFADAA